MQQAPTSQAMSTARTSQPTGSAWVVRPEVHLQADDSVELRFAAHSLGKVFNYAWSLGMFLGPIVALVLLWDDPGSTSFVLTAIGLGIVFVGVIIVSNVWKTPTYNVILAWDPEALPADWRLDGGATSRSTGSSWR